MMNMDDEEVNDLSDTPDELTMAEKYDADILDVLESLIQFTVDIADAVEEPEMPAEITMEDQNNAEISGVMEMIVRKTIETADAEGEMEMCLEMIVDEIILDLTRAWRVLLRAWRVRSRGQKAKRKGSVQGLSLQTRARRYMTGVWKSWRSMGRCR